MRCLPFSLATLLLTASALPVFAQPAPSPPPTYAPPYAPGPMPMLPPAMEPKRRSTGMMVAGIVLTSVASLSLVSGIVASVASTGGGDGGTILFAVVGLPLIGASTIFAGIGIPLWVVGASTPKPRYAEAIPRLSVGAGSAALRWTF